MTDKQCLAIMAAILYAKEPRRCTVLAADFAELFGLKVPLPTTEKLNASIAKEKEMPF
jgi:hypothetical protein